ncbi:MAG: alpha/beta hydrolase [Gemmiger sp.]
MPKKKNDLSQRLEAVIKTLVPQQEQNPDDLGPMMRAIKAVHSISDHTSTTPEDLERQRAGQELFARLVTPSIGIRNDSLTVGNIPAEWISLEHGHDRRHAVLYCHGGGYTCGQLGYARILASKLALATGFDVLSFEYRLAPEHPFPAAIEDALAVWDYLMYMGYGARDVIVAGDSAGGNLALELALKLKEQGRAQPRGLLLFSPWTDDGQRQELPHLQDAGPDADDGVHRRRARGLHRPRRRLDPPLLQSAVCRPARPAANLSAGGHE